MGIRDDADFIATIYDELLANSGEAMTQADIREALTPQIMARLEQRDRDIEREAKNLLADCLAPIRQQRSNSLRRDLEYVIDAWTNPDEGAHVDPILSRAYKLGTPTGEDKTLANWTPDDLNRLAMTRYRDAAEVMRAARELDNTVTRVVQHMNIDGRPRIGAPAAHLGDAA